MEALFSWQQANCATAQLYESILSSYFAHMFLDTKNVASVLGCYASTVTMATKDCSITQQYGSILSSYMMHMFLGTKCITGLLCCYGNPVRDMFLRIIHISVLPSYCGKTVAHQNQMLTSGGNSLMRTISSSWISCKRSFSQMNTTTNNLLPSFDGPILHTLHHTAHILYKVWRAYSTSQTPSCLMQ